MTIAANYTDWDMLEQLAGEVDVPGLSGGLLNKGDSTNVGIASAMMVVPTHICNYLTEQPGCKYSNCGIMIGAVGSN